MASPGFTQSPVYLWGPAGLAKPIYCERWLKALALQFGVIWLSAHNAQIWDAPDDASPTLAVIDDCDQLDTHNQHLAFNLFIESATAGRSDIVGGEGVPMLGIVAAGRLPPVDLPVRDDLRTRLGWGLTWPSAA